MQVSQITIIENIIVNNRLATDRVAALEARGFIVEKRSMGSGGVGQIKNGWMQISYGVGKWNYAYAVKL